MSAINTRAVLVELRRLEAEIAAERHWFENIIARVREWSASGEPWLNLNRRARHDLFAILDGRDPSVESSPEPAPAPVAAPASGASGGPGAAPPALVLTSARCPTPSAPCTDCENYSQATGLCYVRGEVRR